MLVIELMECLDARGVAPFAEWRDKLDPSVRARIYVATYRLAAGNTSSVKGVGEGVFEIRMNTGSGYRIYFGRDGDTLILLLGGGTKKRQHDDIDAAKSLWKQYRAAKDKGVPHGNDSQAK